MPRPRRIAVMLNLTWPYKRHTGIFSGTQRYAQEQGWESIIDEYADDTLPAHPGASVPYDGIIARATRKLARRAGRLNVPLVNVWFSSPVWHLVPGVFPDYQAIGHMRAEHLLARGLRRFAGLSYYNERGVATEMKAFARTLAEAGCTCHTERVPLDSTFLLKDWRRTERTIAGWMDGWKLPIGVYVGGESEGRMVAQMCRNRGWRVPEDVALITGWNEEAICEHLRPTLTSVEVGYERIGYEAARLLDRLMAGEQPPVEPVLLPPQSIVVRESTDFFAVDDPLIAAALQFIAAKSHLGIGPDDVARAVTTETRTLQRRFRKYLDRPIATEIRRVRTERAKRELAQSERSLKEIARNVGFGEAMRMYEVFVRELGVTPSQYRRRHQGDQTTS
jgi:LacI family transcriptional regulator